MALMPLKIIQTFFTMLSQIPMFLNCLSIFGTHLFFHLDNPLQQITLKKISLLSFCYFNLGINTALF